MVISRSDEVCRESIQLKYRVVLHVSGGNLSLWMTTDPAVFWHMRKYDGVQVVSAIQLYLDLTGRRGRGEEAAKEIYDRCLAEPFSRVERGTS